MLTQVLKFILKGTALAILPFKGNFKIKDLHKEDKMLSNIYFQSFLQNLPKLVKLFWT